ncbi:hypothetical protein CASFOL_036138 [Castilleja foliolosa]|uniref:ditrans,polycis-polyprenyl diphosphate synthase [(2E,6E)-farnesyldiphosphate specific] n=1 Tax=Castilleja foliolosa TaxID=1961234 RepID=A0ABD3BVU1_9LAMI
MVLLYLMQFALFLFKRLARRNKERTAPGSKSSYFPQFYVSPFPVLSLLELDADRLMAFFSRPESTMLRFRGGMHKMYACISSGGNLVLRLLWHLMHLIVSICYFVNRLVKALESFLISSGVFKRYKNLDISKVKYLAVVIDSDEARDIMKVLELLRWLADIGFKKVCLYDKEGVLKKSKEALALWSKSEIMSKNAVINGPLIQKRSIFVQKANGVEDPLPERKCMRLEVISFSDSKHAVAEAANFLLKKHYLNSDEKPQLTERDMTDALKAIGYGTLEPDLMLIYAPARCHMGFPAWRSRYTEMVHMGPLKSMKLGAIIKAVHRHTTVHQNYDVHKPVYFK